MKQQQQGHREGESQGGTGEGTQSMEKHGPAEATMSCRDLELCLGLNDSSERRENTTEVIEGEEGGLRPD